MLRKLNSLLRGPVGPGAGLATGAVIIGLSEGFSTWTYVLLTFGILVVIVGYVVRK